MADQSSNIQELTLVKKKQQKFTASKPYEKALTVNSEKHPKLVVYANEPLLKLAFQLHFSHFHCGVLDGASALR